MKKDRGAMLVGFILGAIITFVITSSYYQSKIDDVQSKQQAIEDLRYLKSKGYK